MFYDSEDCIVRVTRGCLCPPIRRQQEAGGRAPETTAGSSRNGRREAESPEDSRWEKEVLEFKDWRCSPGCRTPSGGSASTRSTGCPGGSGPGGPEPRPPAAPAQTVGTTSWKRFSRYWSRLLWSHDQQAAHSHSCSPEAAFPAVCLSLRWNRECV